MALKQIEGRSARQRSRPSYDVDFAADASGYAAPSVAFQARTLSRRYGLTPAVAAATADLAYSIPETWRSAR